MTHKALKEYPYISLKLEEIGEKADFEKIFGRKSRIHIEIGSGRGTFLVHQAKAHPEEDFLGIEWASRFYRYSVDRLGRWGVKNARVIRTDAAVFLAENIADETVDCFHIYFPDPWPKKKHHRRRMLQQKNLDNMLRCLKPGGMIRAATDHEEYFQVIDELIKENSDKLEPVDFFRTAFAEEGEWVGTNFERRYIKQGKKIHTLAVKKR